jgi:lysophospholipase L1-like esterase
MMDTYRPSTGSAPEEPRGPQRRGDLIKKLLLTFTSTIFCLLILAAGELICRVFMDIPLLGNSPDLFISNAYGESKGNARNARAISFGADVFTDGYGFRIDPQFPPKQNRSAVLILGDSVGFGPGVDESRSFAGLLRQELTSTTIYNSSVIGYGVSDYKNVVDLFVPQHPEIQKVYLIFCLNDVSVVSAEEIDRYLQKSDRIERMKRVQVIGAINDFLRSRSKLYLFLKNELTDPSTRYFLAETGSYGVDDTRFASILQPVEDIDRTLHERGIAFTVLIMPYEAQFRRDDPGSAAPQKRLSQYFQSHGIRSFDLKQTFAASGLPSKKLFLYGDPMHFSVAGHRILFDWLMKDLRGANSSHPEPSPERLPGA